MKQDEALRDSGRHTWHRLNPGVTGAVYVWFLSCTSVSSCLSQQSGSSETVDVLKSSSHGIHAGTTASRIMMPSAGRSTSALHCVGICCRAPHHRLLFIQRSRTSLRSMPLFSSCGRCTMYASRCTVNLRSIEGQCLVPMLHPTDFGQAQRYTPSQSQGQRQIQSMACSSANGAAA